ncbi:MAG: periplasmic heavy metal sensor [Prolixibacteraceae bacterium]|nr:periplasmic heavy metal sensor [Prolixibacteraceae bacterium]
MKTKILMLVVLLSMSVVLVAQPADRNSKKSFRGQNPEMRMNEGQRGAGNGLNLTDAQKEAFKQSMLATQKQVQPIRNELGEAMARQKTLTTAEKPDLGAINKNIEKIGALKIEIAKIQAKHRLEMRAELTDEQRLKFDERKGKMMQDRGSKGMKHRMRMQG